jgi:hypothetical protein
VQTSASRPHTLQIELTGVVAELYSASNAHGSDTQIVSEALPPIKVSAADTNGACPHLGGDTITFCSTASFPGACNCMNEVHTNGFAVIDNNARLIRRLTVSWDSTFFYGRYWNTFADLDLSDLPYTLSSDSSIQVDVDPSLVVKSLAYRTEVESTAPGSSTWKWTKQINGYNPDARLRLIIGK